MKDRVTESQRQIDAAIAAAGDDGVAIARGSALKPERYDWLWRGWLCRSKLHLLAGQPGVGKTTVALSLAATVTRGGRWPDGSRCRAAAALVWSGEDDSADTLLPRFLAMGGDPDALYFVTGHRTDGKLEAFDPAAHMPAVLAAVERIGDVGLVVLDPVVTAVAGDSHKNTEVRRGLQPIVDLAVAARCAVIGVSHFSKGTSNRDPVERIVGSIAFTAAPRMTLACAKVSDESGEARRIFTRAKSNISADGGGFSYATELADLPGHAGVEASRVVWGDPVSGSAKELLAEPVAEDAEHASAVDEAAEFLRQELGEGLTPAAAVFAAAKEQRIAERTLKRAKTLLGIESRKGVGGWYWRLPDGVIRAKGAKGAKGATLEKLARLTRPGDTEEVAHATQGGQGFQRGPLGTLGTLDTLPGSDSSTPAQNRAHADTDAHTTGLPAVGARDRRHAIDLVRHLATCLDWTEDQAEAWTVDAMAEPTTTVAVLTEKYPTQAAAWREAGA